MKPLKEHRHGKRIAAAMWVRLSGSGAEIGMGSLANASVSGAFLETEIRLPLNSNLTLEPISSAGDELGGVQIGGRVARIDDRGLGIEWHVHMTLELLALLTESPGLREEDLYS